MRVETIFENSSIVIQFPLAIPYIGLPKQTK
jgi:hypothetical protein